MQKVINSELRYRRLFEAAQDGILILDAETGMIEDVNPYLIKILGYSREEFIEKRLWEVGAFRDIESSKEAFEALLKNDFIRYEDLPLKTKDGRLIEVEFVSTVYLVGEEKTIQCNIRDISEHRKIIAALQDNEKKYHDLINQSPDGYFIIEVSGNILTVNEAMCKALKFEEEEFLSMSIWDIIPEEFLGQYRERLTKILKGESLPEATEYEVYGKNGNIHYVEVLSAPRYSGGNIIGFQGVARNISDRKRAENALLESEEKLRRLVEHLPTVVYTNSIGDSNSTIYVSPQIKALSGYTSAEWLADPKLWSKSLHPDDRQHVLKRTGHTDQVNEPFNMEYRMIARDSHVVWVHDQVTLVHDLKGQPTYWQGIMLDITERKQMETALIESEQRLVSIYNTVGDIIYQLAVEEKDHYRFTSVNRAFLLITGLTSSQVIGRRVDEIIHEPSLSMVMEKYSTSIREKKILTWEETSEYPAGKLTGEVRITPVFDEAGHCTSLIGSIHDITERKQAEETIRQYANELERRVEERTTELTMLNTELIHTQRAKDEFFANMSHELRTPLNSILGLSEIMLEQKLGPLNEKQEQYIRIMESNGQHLLDVINDILEVAKVEAGKLELHPDIVSVKELCESSLNFIRESAVRKSISVDFRNDQQISTLHADPQRLKQILVNLLNNAVKFTPANGAVALEVHLNAEKDQIYFSVKDTGIGIAQEDLPKLFTPFTQLDIGLSRQYEGTGLGLVLVLKLTDLHGGSVKVESEPNVGSRFTITLPWTEHNPEERKSPSRSMPPVNAIQEQEVDSVSRGKILLAEDNESNVLTIAEYLLDRGYEVVVAHDGAEAIDMAEELSPDIILMDIQMPKMNGLEATQRLRVDSRFDPTPIIALTALAMPGDRERCLNAGANEYMSKPVSLKGLVKTIEHFLQHNKQKENAIEYL